MTSVTAPTPEEPPVAATLYNEGNGREIAELLVGRRIVSAEMGEFTYPGRSRWDEMAEGRLVLDDGTTLFLTGNWGAVCCSSGAYPLQRVATVNNIITNAWIDCSPGGDGMSDYDGSYSIFVIADAVEINVAHFAGSDGNGCYGTGFTLHVVPGAGQ